MLNAKDYDIRTIPNMPSNVIIGLSRDWMARNPDQPVSEESLSLTPMLRDLVRPFAMNHSDWRFEAIYPVYTTRGIDGVTVYKDNEKLGEISLSCRQSKYYITSPLIRQKLERGGGRETKDLEKAKKWLLTMQPMTLEARGEENRKQVASAVDSGIREIEGTFLRRYRELSHHLRHYIRKNMDTFAPIAKEAGMSADDLEAFERACDEYDSIRPVAQARIQGRGKFVAIRNGVYVVSDVLGDSINQHVVYSHSDSLPDYIRRGVGMLKLSADNNFIHGIGFRYKENRYFVIEEQGV